MSRYPWYKFYPRDWTGNPHLRSVSLGARGLWVEMLNLMHDATPHGYLVVGGQPILPQQLARFVGASETETALLFAELTAAGVYYADRKGLILSRRMIAARKLSESGSRAVSKRYREATVDANQDAGAIRTRSAASGNSRPLTAASGVAGVVAPIGHRIPENWQPSAELEAWTLDNNAGLRPILDHEVQRFVAFYSAKSGPGAEKVDWEAAWRAWVLNDALKVEKRPFVLPPRTQHQATVKLHRDLDRALFDECEKVTGQKAPTFDHWSFPKDVVDEARALLDKREQVKVLLKKATA